LREIGTLPKDVDAKALSDHLLSLGIATRLAEQPDGWAVWVYNEDHLKAAREELEAFRLAPDDPRYHGAAQKAEAVRREREQAEKRYRKNFRDMSGHWDAPLLRRSPLTAALILLCVAVAFRTDIGHRRDPFLLRLTLSTFGIGPDGTPGWQDLEAVRRGEVWRLVTPIFIHFGFIHLLFNLWWLRDLGGLIEARRGTARFALLVLAAAVISNLGQYFIEGPSFFGGMSGVVYALFGYVWVKGHYQPEQGMGMHPNNVTIMIAWLFLCMTGLAGPIANGAHGVGLVVGLLAGLLRF
jgi:GlpG protein